MRLFIGVLLIVFVFITGCSQGTKDTINKEATTQMQTDKQMAVQDTSKPISFETYDIKGISTKLTEKGKNSMDKWRFEIAQTVRNNQGTAFINGNTSEKLVALTFDDGPDTVITPKILDILKQYHVHGNFFFVGNNVKTYPSVVKTAYEEGNLVGNHSFDHPDFNTKTEDFINNEIKKNDDVIHSIIGKTPVLVRPPYGIINDNVLRMAKSQGKKLVIWSTDTLDWSQKDKSNIVNNVMKNVRPGEIILMHSNTDKKATAEALPLIIEGLQKEGYKIVTLDLLINTEAYK